MKNAIPCIKNRSKTHLRRFSAVDYASVVNNANWIVSTFITESPYTEFAAASANEVQFASWDPVTGDTTFGSYTFNEYGVATNYGFLMKDAGTGLDFFASNNLSGGYDDFLYHAYSLFVSSYEPYYVAALYEAATTTWGQGIANLMDSFVGANPYDPGSTVVKFGAGEYYFA